MIWLVGNRGMLGTEVAAILWQRGLPYFASDKEADIADLDQLRQFVSEKPLSWVINCSAYTAVDKAEDEPELAFRVNTDGPGNLAAIARDKGAKLIHISTDYVYDGTKEGEYVETDIPNPLGVYGTSKYQGEVHIQKHLNEHFILRTSWLYGRHGNNFVYTMLRLFKERDEVHVVGDQWGSPTYAPDLAGALLEIIRLNSDAYGIYHFTNEGMVSWYDFAFEIYRLARKNKLLTREVRIQKISTAEYPTNAKRPQNSCLSKSKIKNTFNITSRSWQVSLRSFFKEIDKSSLE
jgi:dTDP-4-dehydrorhamnose reductase